MKTLNIDFGDDNFPTKYSIGSYRTCILLRYSYERFNDEIAEVMAAIGDTDPLVGYTMREDVLRWGREGSVWT